MFAFILLVRFVALFWMRHCQSKGIPLHVQVPFKFIQQVMPTFEIYIFFCVSCIPSNIHKNCAISTNREK